MIDSYCEHGVLLQYADGCRECLLDRRLHRMVELKVQRDRLEAQLARLLAALRAINPDDWNDGCGCCAKHDSLDECAEWLLVEREMTMARNALAELEGSDE